MAPVKARTSRLHFWYGGLHALKGVDMDIRDRQVTLICVWNHGDSEDTEEDAEETRRTSATIECSGLLFLSSDLRALRASVVGCPGIWGAEK